MDEVLCHQMQGLSGNPSAPAALQEPVADTDLARQRAVAVHLSKAAEAVSFKNAKNEGFFETFIIQMRDDKVCVRILFFLLLGGEIPIHGRTVHKLPKTIRIGGGNLTQGDLSAVKAGNIGKSVFHVSRSFLRMLVEMCLQYITFRATGTGRPGCDPVTTVTLFPAS